ncbi:MAG: arsenate reductase (glutaredoxin) [Gammaproteobacteria bacterium]
MSITLYHNPRCSKSRAALELLETTDIAVEVFEYLKETLTVSRLSELVTLLGVPAIQLVRQNEPEWERCGANAQSPASRILEAICDQPVLLQRPIAVRGQRAVVGRPPERVLELL